jgi:hypothetical protein
MAATQSNDVNSDTDDNLVPTFSRFSGKYAFQNGVEFKCNILTSNKINKERSFKGFFTDENEEEE